jgi:hypothetical protein
MMEDQVDSQLESEYAAATERARRFVAGRYLLEECEKTEPDYPTTGGPWREVWRVQMPEFDRPTDFILAIPPTFPDRMPKVYLTISIAEELTQIPHVDNNRLLCAYDEEMAKSNADRPGEIVIAVLDRAAMVFNEGLSGPSEADYLQELQAYWGLDCDSHGLSLVDPLVDADSVMMLRLEPNWRGYSYLLGVSEQLGKDWLKAVGCSSKTRAEKVPLLHLQTIGKPPFPQTNGEVYRFLQEHDPANLKVLLTHLQRSQRPSAVVFSAPTDGHARMMGAWWHPVIAHEVNRGPAHRSKRHKGVIPGFGSTKTGSAMIAELSIHYRQAKLVRATVERVDKARLFQRTAGQFSSALEDPVNVIGCGSLGSLTAVCLAQSGAADTFRIVDPQTVTPENVQRHYCGMSDIGELKAEGTKKKLCAHFPHVSCEAYPNDVLELIRTSPVALTPSSLTLVTVADIAIERRINQLFRNKSSFGRGPLCFLWVEPHLVAGHAIFLNGNAPGCLECNFDNQFRFNHRVLNHPEHFARREAGCQTTFMPYSGVDASQFVASATRFLIESIQANEPRLFSWIGDIDNARRNGFALREQWQSAQAFSSLVSPLPQNPSCTTCGPNEGSISVERKRVLAAFR